MLGKEMDTRYWARLTVDPVRYADQAVENLFPSWWRRQRIRCGNFCRA